MNRMIRRRSAHIYRTHTHVYRTHTHVYRTHILVDSGARIVASKNRISFRDLPAQHSISHHQPNTAQQLSLTIAESTAQQLSLTFA
jgi:hypothetical protein